MTDKLSKFRSCKRGSGKWSNPTTTIWRLLTFSRLGLKMGLFSRTGKVTVLSLAKSRISSEVDQSGSVTKALELC